MKLRIRGNSVRLRVSQTELDAMAQRGFTEDRIRFGPGSELVYRLAVAPGGGVSAELAGTRVCVSIPRAEFERWLAPSEVSIRAEQPIGQDERLAILVEKDFECLQPREGEDASDLFPNPAKSRS
ncbi:MAG TPA: hypothetical protein VFV10_04690 [Gammaproteobacteria bacterium]|nr:hypothetical protein [Gammaproteobacteria bacterium]